MHEAYQSIIGVHRKGLYECHAPVWRDQGSCSAQKSEPLYFESTVVHAGSAQTRPGGWLVTLWAGPSKAL